MSDHLVNPAAVAADDALLTRVSAGATAEQVTTELEQLLVAWRDRCHAAPTAIAGQQRPNGPGSSTAPTGSESISAFRTGS